MSILVSNRGITALHVGIAIALSFLTFFIGAFLLKHDDSSSWPKTALEEAAEKTRLVQTMRSGMLASAEAEKSSVMADTDEASKSFAEQSDQSSQDVEKARIELAPLVEKNSKEAHLLNDFNTCWEKLQAVDKEVLLLAVQNTNFKALRLSFVPAATALKHVERSLNLLMDSVASAPNAADITRLASRALTGVFNISLLQAPHITEATDAGMERMEARMNELDEQVGDALNNLGNLVGESGRSFVSEARKSYEDFQYINTQIVGLSRRNSNIRSFAVSLGQKRNIMAQCLDRLSALEEAVREGAETRATR